MFKLIALEAVSLESSLPRKLSVVLMKMVILWLFLGLVDGCSPPAGSVSSPIYVDISSSSSSGDGSSCAPYVNLADGLKLAATMAEAEISVLTYGPYPFPVGTISNTLEIGGDSFGLIVQGQVLISGSLSISNSILSSVPGSLPTLMTVTGSLTLSNCKVSGLTSTFLVLSGETKIQNSEFSDNAKAVFSVTSLGSVLKIVNCTFLRNSDVLGAVFNMNPTSASSDGNTTLSVSDSSFTNNTATLGGSVLCLNDFSSPNSASNHSVAFFNCKFSGDTSSTFQISTKLFTFQIDNSSFTNESQILTGTLANTTVSVSNSTVRNSHGPLFLMIMTGLFKISTSNFTNIAIGPLVAVTGVDVDVSKNLVILEGLRLRNFKNPGTVLYGNLLNTLLVTALVSDVHMTNFTGITIGAYNSVSSVLIAVDVYLKTGRTSSNIIGEFVTSSISFVRPIYDGISSGGAMTTVINCDYQAKDPMYINIYSLFNPLTGYFDSNFFIIEGGTAMVDGLKGYLVVPGTTLMYVMEGSLTVKNSYLVGPLGMGMFTNLGGQLTLRNCSIDFTTGQTIIKSLLSGVNDIDSLLIQNVVLNKPIFSFSSESVGSVQQLVLRNMTCKAVSAGVSFNLSIANLIVTDSIINALVYFSLSV